MKTIVIEDKVYTIFRLRGILMFLDRNKYAHPIEKVRPKKHIAQLRAEGKWL